MLKLAYPKFWQNKNSIIAKILWLPSMLYYFASLIRKFCIKPVALDFAKVICVGNLTVGGTGKTQVVKWLVEFYKPQGLKILVVSRAYKAKLKGAVVVDSNCQAEIVGDEALMLADFADVVATSKLHYAIPLINQLQPEIIILDDGLQNPTIVKDMVILVIDGYRIFGNEYLLPAGPLRDYPNPTLQNSRAIIVVGSGEVNKVAINYVKQHYLRDNAKDLFNSEIVITNNLQKTEKYFAFSGIGNPERFLDILALSKVNVIDSHSFSDHHLYTKQDIDYLINKAKHLKAKLITTSKDYIKLKNRLEAIECKIELKIHDSKLLEKLLHENTIKKN